MKKYLLNILLLGLVSVFAISCSSDDDDNDGGATWVAPDIKPTGVYILNTGSWSETAPILATLSYYDTETGTLTENMFNNQNKIEMGDTGQDMLIYGSKMYISVSYSNRVYVTDHAAKLYGNKAIIEPKTDGGEPMNPRSLIAHNGKVYTSVEEGYVLRIDTTTMAIDKYKVGQYPEQMTIVNNKLYVVNSRTPSKTISVINLNTFTKAQEDISLPISNPYKITSDKNENLYVIAMGDYKTEPNALYKIETGNKDIVTELGQKVATAMAMSKDGDKLLLMNEIYDPATYVSSTELSYYDTATGEIKESFVKDNTDVSKVTNITVNPNSGEIYLSVMMSYTKNGSMLILSPDGKLKSTISDTKGLNPAGAYFFPQK